ncbi:MAG: metabolite traffic protein EboE, partial [Planctomycetota bacterium]
MEFRSSDPAHAGRVVRLGYCLNLHPSETLDDVRAAIEGTVAPLRARLAPDGSFGVGLYLGAGPAHELVTDPTALAGFATLLESHGVDPFTFNAFPIGGFQEDGLKERVYAPDWTTDERLRYTIEVARAAAALVPRGRVVSISTHPGAYGPTVTDRSMLRRAGEQLGRAVKELARLEAGRGVRIVLSLEAEPDASARNTRAVAETLVFAHLVGGRVLQDELQKTPDEAAALMRRHLGVCLDACHSAVEFEDAEDAVALAADPGPLGKIQFSSALRLENPGDAPAERAGLLDLDEPRFLHQVTGIGVDPERPRGFAHLPDLPALKERVEAGDGAWLGAGEWRCHFHVPIHAKRHTVAGGA